MPRMSLHPAPLDLMLGCKRVEPLPQTMFFTGFFSAVRQPRRFQSCIQTLMPLHILNR